MPTRIAESQFLQQTARRMRRVASISAIDASHELLKIAGELDMRAAQLELDMIADGVIEDSLAHNPA